MPFHARNRKYLLVVGHSKSYPPQRALQYSLTATLDPSASILNMSIPKASPLGRMSTKMEQQRGQPGTKLRSHGGCKAALGESEKDSASSFVLSCVKTSTVTGR
mmetsp:Transcript_26387/g.76154  ORF Transcript_26387/g.76154 Transcript_26387/m.76154 type:complete len:104 (-) Transcript_26387:152-463(-)